ncbi:hypothetical protein [Herbiconiux daphne]|uniref:DUF2207 domain-containing protein n=1 Tax=Herbiconiux daphne TaxID=2970914 RepID=A0ABT2H4T7_9MICO|nr:hypothetical protein [Herbiconiux daphne]MCS5734957.1 hypothetical protein [Herbiconiux daphne]
MFYGGGGGLFPILLGILSSVVSVLAGAIVLVVVLGVLFLLVRFLWFGTRAAQVYLVKNGESGRFTWPVRPVGPEEPAPEGAAQDSTAPEGTAPDAAAPGAPAPASWAPAPESAAAAPDTTAPAPAPVSGDTNATEVLPNAASVPPPPPARAPRKPKSPPAV